MPLAWACIAEPERHGAFLQAGLDALAQSTPDLQPRNRYACPPCIANRRPGWLRPATETEAARIAAQQQGA